MHRNTGKKFDFLFEGEYAIFPEGKIGGEEIIELTDVIVEDSAQKPKLITGTKNIEKFVDNVIANLQNGRKAGEWFAGKRLVMPKTPSYKCGGADTVRDLPQKYHKEFSPDGKEVTPAAKKYTPHKIYTPREIERINRMFEGCGDRLMADQMLRMKGMRPQYAMSFLLARGSHISRADVEDIYLGIPKEERNAIPIYDDRLGLFTNTYANRLEELKKVFPKHKYSKNLTASQGTLSP